MKAIEVMRALIDGHEVEVNPNHIGHTSKIRLSDDGSKIECYVMTATSSENMFEFPKITCVWKEYPCAINDKDAKLTGFDLSFQEAVEAMKKGECCVRSEKPWDVYCMDFEDGPLIRVSNYNPTASFSHIASLNMDEISDKWKIKPKL